MLRPRPGVGVPRFMQALSLAQLGLWPGVNRIPASPFRRLNAPGVESDGESLVPSPHIIGYKHSKSQNFFGGSMSRPLFGKFAMCVVIVMMVLSMATITWGQATQGRVDVTVLDEKNAYVPGAKIAL